MLTISYFSQEEILKYIYSDSTIILVQDSVLHRVCLLVTWGMYVLTGKFVCPEFVDITQNILMGFLKYVFIICNYVQK